MAQDSKGTIATAQYDENFLARASQNPEGSGQGEYYHTHEELMEWTRKQLAKNREV